MFRPFAISHDMILINLPKWLYSRTIAWDGCSLTTSTMILLVKGLGRVCTVIRSVLSFDFSKSTERRCNRLFQVFYDFGQFSYKWLIVKILPPVLHSPAWG